MANLAIKGHSTRGKEVIQLLEMLGGKNLNNFNGASNMYYLIGLIDPKILWVSKLELDKSHEQFTYFTLEEFEEKFPYKIGNTVLAYCEGIFAQFTIQDMRWNYKLNKIEYRICQSWCDTSLIRPYKEETMEKDTNKAIFDGNTQSCDIMNDIIKEESMEDKGTLELIDLIRESRIADEVEVVLGDYEFVLKDGKTYFVKKNKYPKTYEECCECLSLGEDSKLYTKGYKASLIQDFQKLLICRNAYWKMAGEEMGLDKPWKPDWEESDGGYRYCIINRSNKIVLNCEYLGKNYILSFPTAEMRDMFYENFKDLIEQCKELL